MLREVIVSFAPPPPICSPLRIGFPFPKLLRNFCGTKRKIFLSLRIIFARKNNNLRNHSQKSFRAKFPYSAFAKLKFCAIPQFRKNQTVGDGVFLRIQFWKNLVLECLPFGHFYIIFDHDS